MKERIFELHEMQQVVRSGADVEEVTRFLAWPPDADKAIDKAVAALGYDAFTFQILMENTLKRGDGRLPWALIQFSRNYRLAGHLRHIRRDPRELGFTSLSLPARYDVLTDGIPPVSTVFAFSKDALGHAAARSPLLAPAWTLLADVRDDCHFFCLADPSDMEWVQRQEFVDDELFCSQLGRPAPAWSGWGQPGAHQ